MTPDDITHLATLARVHVDDEEKANLAKELDSVLGYVSEVATVVTGEVVPLPSALRNVMREDDHAYTGGEFREGILANAPDTEDGYLKVKQIF
jgi:aspartyl-tRNA(Asn)/glutamyl-tRNA(Gln) amidotransferase subunit C